MIYSRPLYFPLSTWTVSPAVTQVPFLSHAFVTFTNRLRFLVFVVLDVTLGRAPPGVVPAPVAGCSASLVAWSIAFCFLFALAARDFSDRCRA